jgi:IPT/TIG domain
MMPPLRTLVAAVAVLVCAATAAPASATTIVMGPPDLSAYTGFAGDNCDLPFPPSAASCTFEFVNLTPPTGSTAVLTAPADGTVTTWTMAGSLTTNGPATATATLDIARPTGMGQYVSAGASTPSSSPPSSTAVNLPILAGDGLAALIQCSASPGGACSAAVNQLNPAGASYGRTQSPLSLTTPAPLGVIRTGVQAGFNATVALVAPVVSGVTAATGDVNGGETVTISGQHLAVATGATFDGAAAAIVSGTDSSLTVRTPPHAAGLAPVTVTTAGGTGGGASYRYGPVPVTPPPDTTPTTATTTAPTTAAPPANPQFTISVGKLPTKLKLGKSLKIALKLSKGGRFTLLLSGSACPKPKKGHHASTGCSSRSKSVKAGTTTITIPTSRLRPGKLTFTITVVSADKTDKLRQYTGHVTLNR